MSQKPKKTNKRVLLVLLTILLLAAIITGILVYVLRPRASAVSTAAGVAYIQALEQTDTAAVEDAIKEIERQERRAALERGDVDVWQQLSDAVIMGDSRAVGFSYYGYMEERRVLADGGATLKNIPDYIAGLQNVNPAQVFLCFGLNDISIGYWDTVEEYIIELDSVVSLIEQSVSGIEVYVCSTIPAIDPAFERAEKWRDIPTWNTAIKAHCEETGISYIDLTDTLAAHMDLYDPDGIHMQKAFYPYWAIDLVAGVQESEN